MKKKQDSSRLSTLIVTLGYPKASRIPAPTFCRMTKAILKDQMQRNGFTQVDDIVVASRKKATQIDDLVETFANMCRA
jgi:hypothetical protein